MKKDKGGGKDPKGARPPRKLHECNDEDHIALNCPVRASRVAAAGVERLEDPMAKGYAKCKGKGPKNEKGKGKQLVGVWTPNGDHGGAWIPTRA